MQTKQNETTGSPRKSIVSPTPGATARVRASTILLITAAICAIGIFLANNFLDPGGAGIILMIPDAFILIASLVTCTLSAINILHRMHLTISIIYCCLSVAVIIHMLIEWIPAFTQ